MNDIHRRVFKLYLMEQDRLPLNPAQQVELQAHLLTCPACRADQQIYQGLRAQAGQRWPVVHPPVALEKVLRARHRSTRLHWLILPLRAALWIGLALLVLALIQWIFTTLRPMPAILPPTHPTPTVSVNGIAKIPLAPLLQGDPIGQGSWSPQEDFFFIPILDNPALGGDRRLTSLHFIATSTGQDCRASELLPAQQDSQAYAWLDNEHVLFIDKRGRPLLYTPCQAGLQDLSDLFSEALVRVAMPVTNPELATQGSMLLEGPSAYWLLDPVTLQAHPLADPVPSPDQADSFAWIPSGHQISVTQPVVGNPDLNRLEILDLDIGIVLRSIEIEASNEGRAPLVEWLGPQRPFVWSLGSGGPLMIDLSVDPPQKVRVLPDLFGLTLTYPDQISSMGVFYNPVDGNYHIVAHLNLPEDRSIYLYHGETGQVEKLVGDQPVMMIFPGDQSMPLIPWQDTPTYADGYTLVWVDRPEQPQTHLQVNGHTPRNYPNLQISLLPGSQRLLFGSSQGISMLGLPGGETLAFWQLIGAEKATLPTMLHAPHGNPLIIVAHINDSQNQGSRLYWLAPEK